MARRRNRDADLFELLMSIVGLCFLLGMLSPAFRQAIIALGFISIGLLVLALIAGVGFLTYRLVVRKRRLQGQAAPLRAFNLNRMEPEVFISPPSTIPKIKVEVPEPARAEMKAPDLLEQLKRIDWFQFEKIVALTYRKLGCTVSRRGGANPDGGIDLLIEKDGIKKAVQCKQWRTWNVGVKAVREFLGALTDAKIEKGIFITLRGYTAEAKQLAEKHGIEILNETGLVTMLKKTDARFDPETLEILKDTRKFCPKCEREMVLRTARSGPGAGQQFWGCSGYPKCHYTMPAD